MNLSLTGKKQQMKKTLLIFIIITALLCLASCHEEQSTECEHKDLIISEVDATCDTEGYQLNECRNCTFEFKSKIIPPKGHTLSEQKFSASCTEEGYTEYTCSCGYSYRSDYTEPVGHVFATETHTPTCTIEGFTRYTCHCGFTYRAKLTPPTGHTLKKEVHEPDCTNEGYTDYSCTVCKNYSFRSNYVVPLGHSFTTTVSRPTSSQTGYTEFLCHCGYEYTGDYVMSSDIFKGAYVDGVEVLAQGVDVSMWNGTVNWSELKTAGIDYVILKAGSTNGVDPNFETNYKKATEAGLGVGCYYYTYSLTVDDILEDAESFLSFIKGKKFDYPVYLDLEDPSQEALDSQLLTDMCKAFIEKMQSEGYFCGLYVNNNWLMNKLDTERITVYFDLWLARWTLSGEPDWSDKFGVRTGMWQYSATGKIGSHTCDFDLNVAFKDYPSLIKEWGFNGYEK